MLRTLLGDESGFIISGEITIVMTLLICGTVVGMSAVRDSLVFELHDVSEAIGAVSQSYNFTGIQKPRDATHFHGRCSGSGYNDDADVCDCHGIVLTQVCGKDDPSNSGIADGT
jgi:hypothetical protein